MKQGAASLRPVPALVLLGTKMAADPGEVIVGDGEIIVLCRKPRRRYDEGLTEGTFAAARCRSMLDITRRSSQWSATNPSSWKTRVFTRCWTM